MSNHIFLKQLDGITYSYFTLNDVSQTAIEVRMKD